MLRLLSVALLLLAQALPVTRLAGTPLAGGVGDQPPAPAAGPPAPAGQPRSPQPSMPATRLESGAPSLDSPRRVSLAFAEARPIEEILGLLLAETGFSVAIDAGIEGAFRGELKDLTLREALAALLDPLGLDFDVRGTVVRVTSHRTQFRQFDLNLLAIHRGRARPSGALVTAAMPEQDAFSSIAEGVQSLLSADGTVHVDRRAGLAQVTDYPERLDRVAIYLEALQVRSTRQVRLEARVFEVTLKTAAAIDWRAVREKLGAPPDVAQAGLAADPAALQAALADQGDIRVLGAPEVTTMNNEPALVRAGAAGLSSLVMTVVPQIAADGVVLLSVSQMWEEGLPDRRFAAEADTVTRVPSGSTVVIGGLLRPVPASPAGASSGRAAKPSVSRAEIVVLLRASVVTP